MIARLTPAIWCCPTALLHMAALTLRNFSVVVLMITMPSMMNVISVLLVDVAATTLRMIGMLLTLMQDKLIEEST